MWRQLDFYGRSSDRTASSGKLACPSRKYEDIPSELSFRTTAWLGSLARRFVLTAGPLGAVLKLDHHNYPAAIVRSWLPIPVTVCEAANPRNFCPADELVWDFDQLYMPPQIPHIDLHFSREKCDRAEALINYRAVFGDAAEAVGAKKKSTPRTQMPPPPPAEPRDSDG